MKCNKKKELKNIQNTQELWDNFKAFNICIFGIPEEREEKETGAK